MMQPIESKSSIERQTVGNVSQRCSYVDIAGRLLRDKLYLTALELHTELMESGREVQQLKDYFSNPGHFEGQYEHSAKMSRSGSQQTLDSLDLTRFSEDGDRAAEEHVAVLEFELRKAKETINALRNNLTVVTESDNNITPNSPTKALSSDIIKPHERRALNYLINEYLLLNGYKLTSITFADENEDQDFEDWDDVGLNISKPPELLTFYRDGLKQLVGHELRSCVACQTEGVGDEEGQEVDAVKSKTIELETKVQLLETQLTELQTENALTLSKQTSSVNCPLDSVKYSESISSKNSYSSSVDSPEKFEIIDKTKTKPSESSNDFVQSAVGNFDVNDWTNVTIEGEEHAENISENSSTNNQSTKSESVFQCSDIMSSDYVASLVSLCPLRLQENELLLTLAAARVTSQHLVQTVSESLLRIIPNVILAKREEVISLLVFAVILQKDAEIRDKLLQQLFSLKKKPSEQERLLILSGIVGIAQNAKSNLVENELLPQCWEQITHKHVERRLLIAEACRYLIPYISTPIRNSLLLSMLQQLLEDRSPLVRASVVQTLAIIIALCSDVDKYAQCEQLTFLALTDDSATVVNHVTNILFPVLAKWALDNGLFSSNLIKKLLQSLTDSLRNIKDESLNVNEEFPQSAFRYIIVLMKLLPFIVTYVAVNDTVLQSTDANKSTAIRAELLYLCTDLSNPSIFYNGKYSAGEIIATFDNMLEDSDSFMCPQLEWLLHSMLPDLLNSLVHIESLHSDTFRRMLALFTALCRAFGGRFVRTRLRPLFAAQIASLEQMIANNVTHTFQGGSLHVVPVYLVAVLCQCDGDGGGVEVGLVVRRFLCALPICGVPIDCLEVSVVALSRHSAAMCDVVLAALWEGVVHARPLVRATTVGLFAAIVALCTEEQLSAKLVPALVTLTCDTDLLVRIAAIPALGRLITDCQSIEVHDKAYMQLQIYLSDSSLKDNHTLLRQLVVTLGTIVTTCKATFRNDVILPQLSTITTSLLQTTNLTRKIDMATALIEAYVNTIYSPLQSSYIISYVLPGLRSLEQLVLANQPLHQHLDAVRSMLRETENRADLAALHQLQQRTGAGDVIRPVRPAAMQVANQGVEEMRQKVSKLFQSQHTAVGAGAGGGMTKSNTLSNIQGLFKKK